MSKFKVPVLVLLAIAEYFVYLISAAVWWEWFITPLTGAPVPSLPHILGLGAILSMLGTNTNTFRLGEIHKKVCEPETIETISTGIAVFLIRYLYFWILALTAYWLMQ